MIRGSITRRYAKALLELAIQENKVDRFGEHLKSFADLLAGNDQLFNSLKNPAHAPEERKAVLVKILDMMDLEPMVINFVLLVNDRRRIEHLPGMAFSYGELADKLAGRLRARVTTAADLKPEQQNRIKSSLTERMGKDVVVTLERNPDIIGGVVAQVGNLKFDYSLRNQLRRIRRELVG